MERKNKKSGRGSVCRRIRYYERIENEKGFKEKMEELHKRKHKTYKKKFNKRCIDCNKLIVPRAKRCLNCATKKRLKLKHRR
jgi:hypothetical protein